MRGVPETGGALPVAVLGAGGWGTALAIHLANAGRPVRLWARRPDFAAELAERRENARYLPGLELPEPVRVTGDLEAAVAGAGLVLLVPPSHAFRDVARRLAAAAEAHGWAPPAALVSATKGLEADTLARMTEVVCAELPPAWAARAAVLSGPTFALEVARGLPAATVVAAGDPAVAEAARTVLMSPRLRVYTNRDVVGVELGGALKNVVAIAVGIVDGLGLGHNTRAALITRGLAEIARLGVAMGASPVTFAGLSGMGDLVLTATGDLSRNRRFGLALARGERPEALLATSPLVVEGVPTTRAAVRLADRHGVPMPIAAELEAVLFRDRSPRDGVAALMAREPAAEDDLAALLVKRRGNGAWGNGA